MREPGRFSSSRFKGRSGGSTEAPLQTAPVVQSATISGTTTPTGDLVANVAASGNPTPAPASIQWTKGGVDIPGATGSTFTKDGAVATDDVIGFRYVVSNGVLPNATGTSQNSVTITAQPEMTATISPNPLVADDDFEIIFSAVPDTVSPSSLVQDPSNPLRYTGIAPANGTLAIGATKAEWQPFAETYTYTPLPTIQPGSIDLEANGTISVTAPDSELDATLDVTAGSYTTAIYLELDKTGPALPPDAIGELYIAGTGGNGNDLTVTSREIFYGDAAAGPITRTGAEWYRGETATGVTALTYTQDAAVDGDKTLTFRETAANTVGATVSVSNGILCPAPALANGVTPIGPFDGGTAATSSITHTTSIDIGQADPDKMVYIAIVGTATTPTAVKLTAAGVDYTTNLLDGDIDSTNGFGMHVAAIACPVGGTVTLSVTRATGTARPRGFVAITKGLSRYGTNRNAVAGTAGTQITYGVGATTAGDTLLSFVAYSATNAAGVFSGSTPLTEIHDAPSGNAQLWVGHGTAITAASQQLKLTPNANGTARHFTVKMGAA